jgi:hypothetical protein
MTPSTASASAWPFPEQPPRKPAHKIVVPVTDVLGIVPAPAGWCFHWREAFEVDADAEHEREAIWNDGAEPVLAFGMTAKGDECAMVSYGMVLAGRPTIPSFVWVRNFNTWPEGWTYPGGAGLYRGEGYIRPTATAVLGPDGARDSWWGHLNHYPSDDIAVWFQGSL